MSSSQRDRVQVEDDLTWAFLLSHHRPEGYSHCIELRLYGQARPICSRCLGQFTAMAVVATAFSVLTLEHWYWFCWQVQVPLYLAPIPAVVDWTVQTVTARSSTNFRRVVTGAFLGVAWVNLIFSIILRFWPWGVAGILALLTYATAMLWIVTRFRKWEAIAAQFPGVTNEVRLGKVVG